MLGSGKDKNQGDHPQNLVKDFLELMEWLKW
jgi:hypothetical protein